MRCDDIRSDLTAFQDGELPSSESQAIEAHLATCPPCAAAAKKLAAAWNALDALPVVAPDSFAVKRCQVRIQRGRSASRLIRWSAAAALALVLGTGWLFRAGLGGNGSAPADLSGYPLQTGTVFPNFVSPYLGNNTDDYFPSLSIGSVNPPLSEKAFLVSEEDSP